MINTILFACGDDFASGSAENLSPAPEIGRGALILNPSAGEGSFVSPILPADDFSTAVMSWNTDLPQGSWSEAFCRVQDQNGDWSQWLSWGMWSPFLRRASLEKTDGGCAQVETDVLSLKKGSTGRAFQLKCVLHRGGAQADPALRLLGVTLRQGREERLSDHGPVGAVSHPVPGYCQGIRDPNMGYAMCSPTSATVLMNALGADLLPEESALACWDHVYHGYGNWAFTMAMAGSFGYETWLEFGDADSLRARLMNDGPVGVSASYSNTHERATDHAPYLENAPGFTPGHLLVLYGIEVDQAGREWLLASDSYGRPDSQTSRRYPLEQFIHAWGGLIYMVRPRLKGAGFGSPFRLPAELKKTEFGDEFRLVCNGEEIPLEPGFNGSRKACGGVIAYTLEDAFRYATLGNRPFSYTKATVNGNLFLPAAALLRASPLGEKARLLVFVITGQGITYTASLTPDQI